MTTDKNLANSGTNVPEGTRPERQVVPFVDIYENQDEILLFADMPGVTTEQLQLRIDKDALVLEGVKTIESKPGMVRSELEPCTYVRSFSLPQTIDGERVSASLEHGVLKVQLPKRESVKPRQIQVTAG